MEMRQRVGPSLLFPHLLRLLVRRQQLVVLRGDGLVGGEALVARLPAERDADARCNKGLLGIGNITVLIVRPFHPKR